MNKPSNKEPKKLSPKLKIALFVSLVIISPFPIFATIAPGEWPLQPEVARLDAIYLLILVGYVLVLSGWYHPKWLVTLMMTIGILGAVAMLWLYLTLRGLRVSL